LTYLRNNPTASVDIIGHADELGRSAYNDKLANARATSVKNTLVKANIADSRLNIISAGEDTSVNKDSDVARKLVRRVTFMVK
jgi:OOP family OmpA-OmpF porin